MSSDKFTAEQDELEAALAVQLQAADSKERAALYGSAYDEIYAMALKDRGETAEDQKMGVSSWMMRAALKATASSKSILEIGCGCGYASLELAKAGRKVTGIDVSKVAVQSAQKHAESMANPPKFLWSEGMKLPFPDGSFDFVFSIEVFEHLHPADIPEHLDEVRRVLTPGGKYWFVTPNGAVQKTAEQRSVHVHLKEWTLAEVDVLLKQKGFTSIVSPWKPPKMKSIFNVPLGLKLPAEKISRMFKSPKLNQFFMIVTGTLEVSVMAARK